MAPIDMDKAYKEEDLKRLRNAINKTYSEKFANFVELMKISLTLKSAKVAHK